jgi:hypothetical protein
MSGDTWVQHLPGVGPNFQDQFGIGCVWEYHNGVSMPFVEVFRREEHSRARHRKLKTGAEIPQ